MKSIVRFIGARIRDLRAQTQKRNVLKGGAPEEIRREEWADSLGDPTEFYLRCFRYFHICLSPELRTHRKYFTTEQRGFGEDAFHSMWFLLFREFKPREFLEIGVYRGQTLSLAALLQRSFECEGETVGISPFSAVGDSVSKYRKDVNYLEDTLANFARFTLSKPALLKAFSTDTAARELITSRRWDCVYIDGNHEYEVARQDWRLCSSNTKPGGIIVLDDAGVTTPFQPPLFATAGHPGPSRLAQEIDRLKFEEILQVGHNRVFQKVA